jgi:hypothetical protein
MQKETVIPKPGVYEGISADEYFSWKAFSKSKYSAVMRSAKHLKHYLETDETTESKTLGSLVDAMVLEPNELDKFAIRPATYYDEKSGTTKKWSGNSHVCKAKLKEMLDNGMTVVKQEMWDTAESIKNGIFSNPTAKKLLESGKKQVAIVWEDESTGVLCKGRIDNLSDSIDDLKTSRDISENSFAKDIFYLGYHIQAGMYQDGWATLNDGEKKDFKFIAVENVPPYDCVVWNLTDESIGAGSILSKVAMKKYQSYIDNDPELTKGYSDYTEPIAIPDWVVQDAFNKGESADVKY